VLRFWKAWRRRQTFEDDTTEAADGTEPEQQILTALASLGDMTAREVMTPRVDVVALSVPVTLDDVARAVRESGHSRFPVYEDDLDHLVGVLFVKDLLRSGWLTQEAQAGQRDTRLDMARRVREPFLVPESRHVLELLSEMRQRRKAFAVVVDEYGGVEGVLTVKDLVSEVVGDLLDEFDRPADEAITRVDRRRWLVDGSCPVDEVGTSLGLHLPAGEYVTLGGFLFDGFGHIPTEGEHLVVDGWELRVTEMDRRRVAKVVIRAPSGTIGEAPPQENGK
jgi:CBS domain containing-hemolysin-like protein